MIINSPGMFGGLGSHVILPDLDQQARIWKAERIENGGVSPALPNQLTDSQITAEALSFLGYFDQKVADKEKADLVVSMKAFQKAQGIAQSGQMSFNSQLALSKAVSAKKPPTQQSLQLSGLLLDSAKRLMNPAQPVANGAVPAAAVRTESRIDGDFKGWEGETVFKLANGQIWQQTEFHYHYHYAFMPKVIILKTATGHKMIVDGVSKAIGVTQLK